MTGRAAALAFGIWLAFTSAANAQGERAKAEQALDQGRRLFALDEGAWVSTDDLLARMPASALPKEGGWVAEPEGPALNFTYFGVKDGAFYAIYRATMSGRRVVRSHLLADGEDRTLTPEALRLAQARATAFKALEGKPCGIAPFNVLPLPADNGEVSVYFLTPMTQTGVFPFGGHFEVVVDKTGKAVSQRAFSKSCLEMKQPKAGPDGPAIAVVSHLMDETPTEIHAFMALRMGNPVVVVTPPGVMWAVSDKGIDGPEPLRNR